MNILTKSNNELILCYVTSYLLLLKSHFILGTCNFSGKFCWYLWLILCVLLFPNWQLLTLIRFLEKMGYLCLFSNKKYVRKFLTYQISYKFSQSKLKPVVYCYNYSICFNSPINALFNSPSNAIVITLYSQDWQILFSLGKYIKF